MQQKNKQNLLRMPQIRKQKKKKKQEKIQQLMKMVNISKLLLKLELKQPNYNKCWLQENKQ